MKHVKFNILLVFGILAIIFSNNARLDGQKIYDSLPIVYVPKCYNCYHLSGESLTIDGRIDEKAWETAPWSDSFVDIEGNLKPTPWHDTKVKMLWDDQFLYIGARMEEPYVWASLHQRDTIVFFDDDFEVFIDPDGDTHNYYEIEVNAYNTIWDLLVLRPYREDELPKVLNAWDSKGLKSAVYINGTINNHTDIDQFWSVEMAIPWADISEMATHKGKPNLNDQWRINFSRVEWPKELVDGKYVRKKDPATQKIVPECNWVWSPQGFIAMHRPETWGFLTFLNQPGEGTEQVCQPDPEDPIKWALRKMQYQQSKHFYNNELYFDDLSYLKIPEVQIDGYHFRPQLEIFSTGYIIKAPSLEQDKNWYIRNDGKIWKQ